jgi:hypothetical protein
MILTIVRHRITVLMLQDEHVVLECDEVQILIVHFVDVRDAARLESGGSQIFELLS